MSNSALYFTQRCLQGRSAEDKTKANSQSYPVLDDSVTRTLRQPVYPFVIAVQGNFYRINLGLLNESNLLDCNDPVNAPADPGGNPAMASNPICQWDLPPSRQRFLSRVSTRDII